MDCGILRIKSITAGGIGPIGSEEDRTSCGERNGDIDSERSHLNIRVCRTNGQTLYRAWQDKCETMGVKVSRKGQIAMEQAVITASPNFFKALGWDRDLAWLWTINEIPSDILNYFNSAMVWAENYFGANNIISATIHMDESSPHMHIDYIPIVENSRRRKDVYARDERGNLVRDEKGHCIRARDATGKVIYAYEEAPTRLSRSDYWQQRGGRQSYRRMQDDFYSQVSGLFGLGRGDIGTGRQHIEQECYKAAEAKRKAYEAEQTAQEALNTVLQAKDKLDTIKRQKEVLRADMELLMDNAEEYAKNTRQLVEEEWKETIALLRREPGGPKALEKARDMIKWRDYQRGLEALTDNNQLAGDKVKATTEHILSLGQRLRNQEHDLGHEYADRKER
ncbi:MAG: plasmid recombination protein [Clostridia bacterium]|nr:plasmid recombination protein [Clostridia bacterium]